MIHKLIYDGSFDGFLSCIFEIYLRKLKKVQIVNYNRFQASFFSTSEMVETSAEHAHRVWKTLKRKCPKGGYKKIYKCYLSELPEREDVLLGSINSILKGPENTESDFGNPHILRLSKIAKMVDREKHRMDAFVRFERSDDNLYSAIIAPDYNVLPLNADHFKRRYADQKWLIFDRQRKYGIYYNLQTVTTVELETQEEQSIVEVSPILLDPHESFYSELWQNYFNATNIKERKNMRLHIKHVPKRYWKYLTEKRV